MNPNARVILVDFDHTLATYRPGQGAALGTPIAMTVERVRRWIAERYEVRVFTARAASTSPRRLDDIAAIEAWCEEHLGVRLRVVAEKDFDTVLIVDDLAVMASPNTGLLAPLPAAGPEDVLNPMEEMNLLDREEAISNYADLAVKKVSKRLAKTPIYSFMTTAERENLDAEVRVAAENKIRREFEEVDRRLAEKDASVESMRPGQLLGSN